MSEIPSDVAASGAQAAFTGREVAKEREARRVGQVDAAKHQIKTVDEAGSTVETSDKDVAIFADAEGSGSEGRENEEAPSQESAEPSEGSSTGIVRDDDGQLHVDIEA